MDWRRATPVDEFVYQHEPHGDEDHITVRYNDDGTATFTCVPCNRSQRFSRAAAEDRVQLNAELRALLEHNGQ